MLADFVDLHDVAGAAAGATASASARKRASSAGAGMAAGQDHLQRDRAVQLDLPGLVDDAHAAAAQFPQNLVSGDRRHSRRNLGRGT